MDTGQKTESLAQLVSDIERGVVSLPEFQRDFVWEIERTFDLFDSFVRDIFVGSLIYGVPTFEITVRELDDRPRVGKGSRRKLKLTSHSKTDIEKLVKIQGFRLLLDGQQRATSIFRAMKGIDDVFFVSKHEEALDDAVRGKPIGKRSLEEMLETFAGQASDGRVCVKLSDVHRVLSGDVSREREKAEIFKSTNPSLCVEIEDDIESSEAFSVYLSLLKGLETLFRQEKLVAYYLLDTDEEKFALFFERSNSRGIQLDFIDILAAKLYSGFNLRDQIEKFQEAHPKIALNREVVVRSISYIESLERETGRSYILKTLNAHHFQKHWAEVTNQYVDCTRFLSQNYFIINADWMPYDNILIPMIAFQDNLPKKDFVHASKRQIDFLTVWYWMVVFGRKYSSAAQSYVVEDAQNLARVARGDFSHSAAFLQRMAHLITSADFLKTVTRKYDALYRGIINFCHYTGGGLLNFENNMSIASSENLEDHHIFPKDYLRKTASVNLDGSVDAQGVIDCVLNRTVIVKSSNSKISNRKPSHYMTEFYEKNSAIQKALSAHMIPSSLIDGEYDELYTVFIDDRAQMIYDAIQKNVFGLRERLIAELKPS